MADQKTETPGFDQDNVSVPRTSLEKQPQDGVDYGVGEDDGADEALASEWQDIPEGSKFECKFKI